MPVAVREFIGAFPYKTRPWAPGANRDPTPQLVGGTELSLERGLLRDPLYRRLKAVREGRVIAVRAADAFAGALGFNSPLSRPYLLKQAVPRLAAAVDGDPATKIAATE